MYLLSTKKCKEDQSDWNLSANKTTLENKSVNQNFRFGYAFDMKCQVFGCNNFLFLIILSAQFL